MGHPEQITAINWQERFTLPPNLRKWLTVLLAIGLVLIGIGLVIAFTHAHEATPSHSAGHAAPWLRRLSANLLITAVYFLGISVLSLFFMAVGYAANAGWYVMIQRVPQTFARFLPIGVLLLVSVIGSLFSVLYEWTHPEVVSKDPILQHKSSYLNLPFFFIRLLVIIGGWLLFWRGFIRNWENLDSTGDIRYFHNLRRLAGGFIVFFALSWSVASWDWLMSTSPHWFSTMFAVYNFANLWITTLCLITFTVALLKLNGFLSGVNDSHIHDLGKFVFAFSIFWTYIFYGQFMLIWYANIPEETFWFYERIRAHVNPQYVPVFFLTLILNFLFPLLGLMSASIKRNKVWLMVVTAVLLFTHWLDTFMVVMPSVAGHVGGLGAMEVGFFLAGISGFGWYAAKQLEKAPYLLPQHHPYLEESMHHSYEPI
ncbi:MAG: quinol:cytochrome C oxidoreductase [Bacteroidia bacterium]|nr:quinol:cytochrome C oxidoreductase [Bacteroidia bacterium]MDW8133956.1 quinol:cytochrome C oxidoreductase [Bacteroidia bacterium]